MATSGGSSIVFQAAQLALIADATVTITRSFYLGSALITSAIAVPFTFATAYLVGVEGINRLGQCYVAAIVCWIAYFYYLTFVLRETRLSDGPVMDKADTTQLLAGAGEKTSGNRTERSSPASAINAAWTARNFTRSMTDPLTFILRDKTLRWLGSAFLSSISRRMNSLVFLYCRNVFLVTFSQLMWVAASTDATRVLFTVCILPLVTYIYRQSATRSSAQSTLHSG